MLVLPQYQTVQDMLCIIVGYFSFQGHVMIKKLDPELRRRLRSKHNQITALENEQPKIEARENVEILVEFTGNLADLTVVGFESRTVIEHVHKGYKIATGTIGLDRLEDFAEIDHIVEVEGPQRYYPLLDYSLPETRANAVHTDSTPFKGDGVVIGVIDSGIDWRHGAFFKPDGSSKILAVWDQMLQAKTGETAGPGGIGVIYTQFNNPATVRTRDVNARNEPSGHGTHVAGIAAGNGRPASCCHGAETYVGVAPNASLVMVRYDYRQNNRGIGENMRIVDGLDFIFNPSSTQRRPQGQPTVVNISLGMNRGPHDGTTMVERAIDSCISGHSGRAIVVAAGNFADTRCHVKGSVPANGSSTEIEFEVREGADFSSNLDLWYDRGGTLNLEITAPGGVKSGPVGHGTHSSFIANPTATANRRSSVLIDGIINGPHGRDNNFQITIRKPTSGNLPHGDWKLTLTNPSATPINFHCWIERGDDMHQPVFLSKENPPDGKIRSSSDSTLSTPSTAKEAIAVANHQARTDWCDCWPSTEIVPSSGRGPVVRNAATNLKPDIAAPGLQITAPKADAANLSGNCCSCCPDACCELYEYKTGTSMAAPHVAGAIALMLEKNPQLTKSQILSHLQTTARPAPAGGSRETWGAGKLNVQDAVNHVASPTSGGGGGGGGGSMMRVHNRFDGENLDHKLKPPSDFEFNSSNHTSTFSATKLTPSESQLLPPMLRILKARMEAVPNGQLVAAVVSRNFSEVRRLINANSRVATLWHRCEGPRILHRLLNGAIDEEFPAAIAVKQQHNAVERWLDILAKYGSQRLKNNIEQYKHTLIELLLAPLAAQVAKQTKVNS